MSSIQTTDRTHDTRTEIPLDRTFWQTVAAHQAADDARDEAINSEINKPYDPSAQVFTDIQSLNNELSVWRSKGGGGGKEVVRLLDQAELGRVKWGQVMTLQVLSYQTGWWILFNPPKASSRSLQAWYSFARWELNWTGPIRIAVAA